MKHQYHNEIYSHENKCKNHNKKCHSGNPLQRFKRKIDKDGFCPPESCPKILCRCAARPRIPYVVDSYLLKPDVRAKTAKIIIIFIKSNKFADDSAVNKRKFTGIKRYVDIC